MRDVWLWWSSGKDAAWALEQLLEGASLRPSGLITTVDSVTGRVPMQGTGAELLALQAAATGLPLHQIAISPHASNEEYIRCVTEGLGAARDAGIRDLGFGDIHLEDVRRWREELFSGLGFECHFPLWGQDTRELARAMIDGGLRARVTGVDPARVDPGLLGRAYDMDFLAALDPSVDACGENGEFHTFVEAGPMLHDEFDVEVAAAEHAGEMLVAEPVLRLVLDGTLDLHGITPREVGDLVDDYLTACRAADVLDLRIVHGKGIGALRETVHARLRRRDDIVDFGLADAGGGSWGATLVTLRPRGEDS